MILLHGSTILSPKSSVCLWCAGDGKKLADIIEGCGAVARECSGKGTRKVDVDAALRKLCGEGELARAQNILRDPLSRDSFVALIDTYDLADNDEEEAK